MKNFSKVLGIVFALSGASAFAQSTNELANWNWHNIVNLQPRTQHLNTLQTPTATLRPYRGTHIKVSVPTSCGEIRYSGITAFGRDQFNRRIVLDIKRIGQTFHRGAEEYYYKINNGRATVFEVGVSAYVSHPWRCNVAVEQADERVDGTGSHGSCDQYFGLVCPAVYDPAECVARDLTRNTVLARERRGNSCEARNAIEQNLCQQRGLHPQQDYTITCRSISQP